MVSCWCRDFNFWTQNNEGGGTLILCTEEVGQASHDEHFISHLRQYERLITECLVIVP